MKAFITWEPLVKRAVTCLTLEGRVVEVSGKKAVVDFGGVRSNVNAAFLKPKPGDRVTVFNGFILDIVR